MNESVFTVVTTLAVATMFWLFFFGALNSDPTERLDAYRLGYAEGKAGMAPRYDAKVQP